MALAVRPLHRYFAAEIAGIELRRASGAEELRELRAAMDTYAVCIFPNQTFEGDEQIAFAERLDPGEINTRNGRGVVEDESRRRLHSVKMTDIANLDERGEILSPDDHRRIQALGNRLWHTDTAFGDPAGRYSLLYAHGPLPPKGGETEFADMRAAYDSLPPEMKNEIEGLRARYSLVYSRGTIGFDAFTSEQRAELPGAEHPLVRTNPRTGRRALYMASHAERIIGWPLAEGRLLLRELMALATLPQFVYRHHWRLGDLVIWDNLATMHRGLAFDESVPRDLRRVTTLDV